MSGKTERAISKAGKPGCIAPAALLDYHRKKLSRPARKEVRRHLRRCPACRRDSRFVAIIVRDENRLIRGLEALLPARREHHVSKAVAALQRGESRPSHSIAAAAAAAAFLLAFLIFPPARQTAYPGLWTRAFPPEPAVKSEKHSGSFIPLAKRMNPGSGDVRERLVRAGFLPVPYFDPPPVAIPDANRALASFEISQKRDREEELFGWSLAYRPEVESPYSILTPR